MFLICSGSAVSESRVNPTRSAKSTVATRGWSCRVTSACPQAGQNRASTGAVPPQEGQVMASCYGRRTLRPPESRVPGGTPKIGPENAGEQVISAHVVAARSSDRVPGGGPVPECDRDLVCARGHLGIRHVPFRC